MVFAFDEVHHQRRITMLLSLFITLLACNTNPTEPEECIDSNRSTDIEAEIVAITNSDFPPKTSYNKNKVSSIWNFTTSGFGTFEPFFPKPKQYHK